MTGALRTDVVERALSDRTRANRDFFDAEAERLARVCHRMAERFARGGRLIAFGRSPSARSDARHVAVEFVHPVIVGKRALPAIGLAGEGGSPAEPGRAARGARRHRDRLRSRRGRRRRRPRQRGRGGPCAAIARERGCLTLAFAPAGAEWEFRPPGLDAPVRQELVETLYHVLWELVHVFFDHRGLLEGRTARAAHDTGASSFLYPFLSEGEHDLETVVADVRSSVLAKVGRRRRAARADAHRQPRRRCRPRPRRCAAARRRRLPARARQRRLGDRRDGRRGRLPPPARPALGAAARARPHRGPGDPDRDRQRHRDRGHLRPPGDRARARGRRAARDLDERQLVERDRRARRGAARGLLTIAMVGYDGGRVAAEQLADHVVVTRSEHIPRIQEAQASAYHVLRELVA